MLLITLNKKGLQIGKYMYYILQENDDGSKHWVRKSYSKDGKTSSTEINGPIVFDPHQFPNGASVAFVDPTSLRDTVDLDKLIELIEHQPKPSSPQVFFCKTSPGGAFEVFLESGAHIARWINKNITVFEDPESRRIIGFRLENVLRLMGESGA